MTYSNNNIILTTMKNKNIASFSRRSFIATFYNGTPNLESFNFTLNTLDDDSELVYSLQEIVDLILDLKVNQTMFFQSNRDNSNNKGIIVRLN